MAKPKIFVSSTYYDLRHIRTVLTAFIQQFGYEPILFERGNILFHHDRIAEQSCIEEVEACDIMILVIGGRYGSLSKEDEELHATNPQKFFDEIRSITRKEYEKARERDLPIFIFVDDGVLSEYRTFLQNRDSTEIKYAHVDDRRIYEMLHDIYVQRTNNFVKGFSSHDDILNWLREQWAGLFADSLKRKQSDARIKNLETQISELSNVVTSLKSYSEEIVKLIDKSNANVTIERVNRQFANKQQIDAFTRNPLIGHLMTILPVEERERLPTKALLKYFLESDNLNGFLSHLKLPEDDFHFLTTADRPARDYQALKAELSGQPFPELPLDETGVAVSSPKRRLSKRKRG